MIGRTNADGGGGVSSDETTVVASQVLTGKTYLGSDTDDEAGTGTMPNIQAVDPAKSISYGSGLAYARMSNGAHITNASSGYPEVSITTQTKSVSPTASSQTVSPDANKVLSSVTVNGVSNLTAGNIKNGVTVGGTAGTYKGLGSAAASQVLSGATFSTASLSNASGTMPNYSGYTSTGNYVSSTFRSATSGYVYASPGGTGYYSTGSYLRIPASNLTAANIKKGVSIMGIIGSWEGYVTSPLYLFNYGTFGGGQTGVSLSAKGATMESGKIRLYSGNDGSARFNNTVPVADYNFLNIVGYSQGQYHNGHATLTKVNGGTTEKYYSLCDNAGNSKTSKFSIASLSETCFLSVYADGYYTSSSHESTIWVCQIYLSVS